MFSSSAPFSSAVQTTVEGVFAIEVTRARIFVTLFLTEAVFRACNFVMISPHVWGTFDDPPPCLMFLLPAINSSIFFFAKFN